MDWNLLRNKFKLTIKSRCNTYVIVIKKNIKKIYKHNLLIRHIKTIYVQLIIIRHYIVKNYMYILIIYTLIINI